MTASTQATDAPERRVPRSARYALRVVAHFYGEQVEETVVPTHDVVQIGNSDVIALPTPDNVPWLAQVRWTDAREAVVVDGLGRAHHLAEDGEVELQVGPIHLSFTLVPQFALRRTGDVPVLGSLVFASMVLAATLLVMQGELLWEKRCEWFGVGCVVQQQAQGMDGRFTAEYLARLLREDYAGEEDGGIEIANDADADKANESFYIPAGADGPITEMGGAEETSPEPIRQPEPEEEPEPEIPTKKEEQAPLASDVGTPIEDAVEQVDPEDGIVDAAEVPEEAPEPIADGPTEEKEGWGIQDWYDERDATLDDIEIELYKRAAEQRLKIDPNDLEALSILSYYQYLDEDYEAAMETYDKYIEIAPEESAGYNNKALVYKRLGEYEKEEGLYRVALALTPGDEVALNNLGVNLAHQGRYDEALAVMEDLQGCPEDCYADLHRAKIYAEMGEDEKALEYLEKSLIGMATLDTLHHIEFRQDIRLDPSFASLRQDPRFHAILVRFYGDDAPALDVH